MLLLVVLLGWVDAPVGRRGADCCLRNNKRRTAIGGDNGRRKDWLRSDESRGADAAARSAARPTAHVNRRREGKSAAATCEISRSPADAGAVHDRRREPHSLCAEVEGQLQLRLVKHHLLLRCRCGVLSFSSLGRGRVRAARIVRERVLKAARGVHLEEARGGPPPLRLQQRRL